MTMFSERFPDLAGRTVPVPDPYRIDPDPEPDPEPTLAGAILATASARYELTEAVRRFARNALALGYDPGWIREEALGRIESADPGDPCGMAETVRAALDDVLGTEIGGRSDG